MSPLKYKAIIFDVGDTLLEAHPGEAQIHADRVRVLGFTVDEPTAAALARALDDVANAQIALEQDGAPRISDEDFTAMLDLAALRLVAPSADSAQYLEKLRATPLPKTELRVIDGTLEVLQQLKEYGYRLGIVSNHKAWLAEHLDKLGLAQFFETIVVSDMVGVEKPDPRIMHIALENLALDASDCLYVGDHPFDVLCARGAGLDCAWIASEEAQLPRSVYFDENYRISRLRELLSILL